MKQPPFHTRTRIHIDPSSIISLSPCRCYTICGQASSPSLSQVHLTLPAAKCLVWVVQSRWPFLSNVDAVRCRWGLFFLFTGLPQQSSQAVWGVPHEAGSTHHLREKTNQGKELTSTQHCTNNLGLFWVGRCFLITSVLLIHRHVHEGDRMSTNYTHHLLTPKQTSIHTSSLWVLILIINALVWPFYMMDFHCFI